MVKTKKTNIHRPLVITGYTLFILLILSVLLSTTIPFGSILFNPHSIKINVTISMLALTIGAILPVAAGYLIGDNSVKAKSKLRHHFNGILFGLLSYWLMVLFTVFTSIPSNLFTNHNVTIVLMNVLPSIGIGLITATLAVMHVRSPKVGHDLFEYKPFAVVLIACILAMSVMSLTNNLLTNSISIYSFAMPCLVVLIGLTSYLSLSKARLTMLTRVTWAAISLSVLFAALYVSFLLVSSVSNYLGSYPTMQSQAIGSVVAIVLSLVGWLVYWVLQVKALPRNKK